MNLPAAILPPRLDSTPVDRDYTHHHTWPSMFASVRTFTPVLSPPLHFVHAPPHPPRRGAAAACLQAAFAVRPACRPEVVGGRVGGGWTYSGERWLTAILGRIPNRRTLFAVCNNKTIALIRAPNARALVTASVDILTRLCPLPRRAALCSHRCR